MSPKIELTTNREISIRRKQIVQFYRSLKREIGIFGKERQCEIGERPQGLPLLFSEYVNKSELDDREFSLKPAASICSNPEVGEPHAYSDDYECLGGYFHRTGWDHQMYELRIFASWHEAPIRKSFELYKLWMVDWLTVEEMEIHLERFKYFIPLPPAEIAPIEHDGWKIGSVKPKLEDIDNQLETGLAKQLERYLKRDIPLVEIYHEINELGYKNLPHGSVGEICKYILKSYRSIDDPSTSEDAVVRIKSEIRQQIIVKLFNNNKSG